MSNLRIPKLHFKAEANFSALKTLERIVVPSSLEHIYSTRYRYVNRPVRETIAKLEEVFKNVPVARWNFFKILLLSMSFRDSVLHIVSLMCHECIHMSFLRREQRLFGKFKEAYQFTLLFRTKCTWLGNWNLPISWKFASNFESSKFRQTSFYDFEGCFTVLKWTIIFCFSGFCHAVLSLLVSIIHVQILLWPEILCHFFPNFVWLKLWSICWTNSLERCNNNFLNPDYFLF